MFISYNWLKQYAPDLPPADTLTDVFNSHLCEMESLEKKDNGDIVFDIKILPNRAHDLLSHLGVARELASLLNIKFIDPSPKYKIPESKPTKLEIKIETDACNRYMGRIVRNVKVGPSPEWVVEYLKAIGQRSINNIVDAANILMYDTGQPAHVFDLDKIKGGLIIRQAKMGEKMTTLDSRNLELNDTDMVVADHDLVLGLAGIKGGKVAEVNNSTKNVIIEIANFDPVVTRKSGQRVNIFTDARKRFENELSPKLGDEAMLELSALVFEMCPEAIFEDIVDIYPQKPEERKLKFSTERISSILGLKVTDKEMEDILQRYNFTYTENKGNFEIIVPPMRLDLVIEEDMAEEIGRIMGYGKLKGDLPKINFQPKQNETYEKIKVIRNKFLNDGYSEVMTYVFQGKGEVEVLASASDKKFLRTNITDGLSESLKLNKLNAPLLGLKDIKIFEIGTVFLKEKEEIHVAYNEGDKIIESGLDEYVKSAEAFLNGLAEVEDPENRGPEKMLLPIKFKMWSLFPFIGRDISVWLPQGVDKNDLKKILLENGTDLLIKEPYVVDSFVGKDGRTSYAFRLVFQSFERTLKDEEVNDIMTKISSKIKENSGWQVR